MFRKNAEKKANRMKMSSLRSHFSKMDLGKRLLLTDGRVGIFKGYQGDVFMGDTFLLEEHGVTNEVPLELYDCLLVPDISLKCPLCASERIMEGRLQNPDGLHAAFRENITTITHVVPTYNARGIILHTCRDCGYIMPFVGVN